VAARQCYHCKQWIQEGEPHDCWTTTERALTEDLSDDLREAWERLRETAASLGEQRIYASHHSIMFSRRSCYFFVRPKRSFLELCVFLGRAIQAPQVRRIHRSSKTKFAHILRVRHRDEVEPPITDWLEEAYRWAGPAGVHAGTPGAGSRRRTSTRPSATAKQRPKRTSLGKGLDAAKRRSRRK